MANWNPKTNGLAEFVYHFANIDNAIAILNSGEIVSRSRLESAGINFTECASRRVIEQTTKAHTSFVRLYFAPKTPTQFHNEGIRPASGLSDLNAHCAVPVFFAFRFVDLIGDSETSFSTGNMGSANVEWGDTEELFDRIPFDLVYHRGSTHGHPEQHRIIFHRHAEVLVPDRLSTARIAAIVCRTYPERRTLLHGLNPKIRARMEALTRVKKNGFYHLDWAFVESVADDGTTLEIKVHLAANRAPVQLRFLYHLGAMRWKWEGPCNSPTFHLKHAAPRGGTATLLIDGHLAFRDVLPAVDAPF